MPPSHLIRIGTRAWHLQVRVCSGHGFMLRGPGLAWLPGQDPDRVCVVAYAFGTKCQQSNQWVLETLASAAAPGLDSRSATHEWLRARGYQPNDRHLSTLTRLGGRITQANIAFDDHPSARRFSNHIDTVTVDSMFAWLQHSGMSTPPQPVQP